MGAQKRLAGPCGGALQGRGAEGGGDRKRHLLGMGRQAARPVGGWPRQRQAPPALRQHGRADAGRFADPELWRECYRAYNDFLLDFDSYAPERILAPPQIPVKFPEDAGAEFERVVQRGAKAVEFVVFDAAKPIIDPVLQ